jgi:hypothetical protein
MEFHFLNQKISGKEEKFKRAVIKHNFFSLKIDITNCPQRTCAW